MIIQGIQEIWAVMILNAEESENAILKSVSLKRTSVPRDIVLFLRDGAFAHTGIVSHGTCPLGFIGFVDEGGDRVVEYK